jgi:Type II site-specific deoxyribonuclease
MVNSAKAEKRNDILDIVETLQGLSVVQVDVIRAIIHRFADEQFGDLERPGDFLSQEAYEYFSMRLAAHHAYSASVLKKENFEHILEEAFSRTGVPAKRANSMTVRGADLTVGAITLSLKTEAARNLSMDFITISKLMEAAWIKQTTCADDVPAFVASMVMPHFSNYDRIFTLRSYPDRERRGFVRYDLREIPKRVLSAVGSLTGADFATPTKTRTTSADVMIDGRRAFRFRLDGSDDKLTINNLDVRLCPLHAWWSLSAPGLDREGELVGPTS